MVDRVRSGLLIRSERHWTILTLKLYISIIIIPIILLEKVRLIFKKDKDTKIIRGKFEN